jgi:threonine-phosphate decarboxylase
MELIKKQSTDKNRKTDNNSPGSVFLVPCSEEEHGGNIYKIAEEIGIPEDKLIDFSASINPLGISRKVKDAIKKGMDGLVNYPDTHVNKLREKLALYHDIDLATIICGNGSTELIYLIPRALRPDSVLIPAPTFSEYERACRISNELRVTSYELKKENSFRINPDEFINAMKGNITSKFKTQNSKLKTQLSTLNSTVPCDMAFLCNPNNPTGNLLKRDAVLEIAEAAKDMKCCLVVDEAFIDFCPSESVVDAVNDNPYLIVLRSMTKFFGLTGLRVGYGVFHKNLIERIKHFKEPWTVNNLAQKAAVEALEDDEYSKQTLALMKKEKSFMEQGFRKIGINFYPSDSNYYLLNAGAQRAVPLLKKKGILVRDCSNFRGLDSSHIRVAVKSRKHNRMLLKELENIFRKIPLHPPFSKGESFTLSRKR